MTQSKAHITSLKMAWAALGKVPNAEYEMVTATCITLVTASPWACFPGESSDICQESLVQWNSLSELVHSAWRAMCFMSLDLSTVGPHLERDSSSLGQLVKVTGQIPRSYDLTGMTYIKCPVSSQVTWDGVRSIHIIRSRH